jgi:hypothetical protein
MAGSACAWLGFVLFIVGLVLTARPVAAVGVTTRWQAIAVAASSLAVSVLSLASPSFTSRVPAATSRLDEFLPEWQFHEIHTRRILAPADRVFAAIRQVRADEIRSFTTLTWIRRFGRPGPPSILNASNEPIIDLALKSGFLALADDAPRELVVGAIVGAPQGAHGTPTPAFFKAPPPGYAIAAMNFLVTSDGANSSWISTETRVFASGAAARRRFAAYWRIIYPGSSLIRHMWLRAIERRATLPAR